MNATYNSTTSYIIKEKKKKKNNLEKEKKGVLLLYFGINLTLRRLWRRKLLLLIWFCLQLDPNSDLQTRVNDKSLSDLHRQHWIHQYLRSGQRDLGAICCIVGSAGENARCPLHQCHRHTFKNLNAQQKLDILSYKKGMCNIGVELHFTKGSRYNSIVIY